MDSYNNSKKSGKYFEFPGFRESDYHSEIHHFSISFSIFLTSYFTCLTVGGILINLILGYTIVSVKKLRTLSNMFIVNLAICDFITAALTVSFDADLFLRGYFPYGTFVCGMREVAFMMSLPASVASLSLLTMERFVSIVLPFKRSAIFRNRNVSTMIIIAWTYALLVAVFPIMYNTNAVVAINGACVMTFPMVEYGLFQAIVNFLLPSFCIILVNCVILKIATKHARKICKQTIYACNSSQKRHKKLLRNIKAVKAIVLLVSVFSFCWLTFIVMVTANILCGICHPREVTWIGNAINYSSIVFNPLLYGFLNKSIRKQLRKKILKCLHVTCWRSTANNSHGKLALTTNGINDKSYEHLCENGQTNVIMKSLL